jgi:hypothetical protein
LLTLSVFSWIIASILEVTSAIGIFCKWEIITGFLEYSPHKNGSIFVAGVAVPLDAVLAFRHSGATTIGANWLARPPYLLQTGYALFLRVEFCR